MAITVHDLKMALSDFPDDMLVYTVGDKVGLTFPKLSEAGPIEGLPKEEMKDAKLDRFVLILPEE